MSWLIAATFGAPNHPDEWLAEQRRAVALNLRSHAREVWSEGGVGGVSSVVVVLVADVVANRDAFWATFDVNEAMWFACLLLPKPSAIPWIRSRVTLSMHDVHPHPNRLACLTPMIGCRRLEQALALARCGAAERRVVGRVAGFSSTGPTVTVGPFDRVALLSVIPSSEVHRRQSRRNQHKGEPTMGDTSLADITEQARRVQEWGSTRISLLAGHRGVTSGHTRDDDVRPVSDLTDEILAARGCSTCGSSTTCRNCDGKGYFSAPWAISCRHCGGSGRCPNR